WMLAGFSGLVLLDEADHVRLPGNTGRIAGILIGDLVEHVVQVVHGVDDFPDVSFLLGGDSRIGQRVDGLAPTTVGAIDIVRRIERMALPRVAADISLALDAEPIEQHDRRADAALPRPHDTRSYAVEVGLVEPSQVKLRLIIQSGAWAGALVGHGIVVDRALLGLGIVASLPGPQAKEIVIMPL